MTRKIVPLIVAGIISTLCLGSKAQELPKDTSKIVQQDSLYVKKSQATSIKHNNPGVLELSIKAVQFGKKTRIQLFYSSPINFKIRGASFTDKKKDICKVLNEKLPKYEKSREIVYVTEYENPLLNREEVDELMKCLNVNRYWIYHGDYFF
ncbi:hypothetical protein HYT23_00425 [Candidatus Pacearchaeota archaeon]|nr:hypothetical protein [Candidatus Pacearchaeota archaeon]